MSKELLKNNGKHQDKGCLRKTYNTSGLHNLHEQLF